MAHRPHKDEPDFSALIVFFLATFRERASEPYTHPNLNMRINSKYKYRFLHRTYKSAYNILLDPVEVK